MKFIAVVVAGMIFCSALQARHNNEHPLSAEEWKDVMEKVTLLEESGLMPTLLPIIMRNRDTIALTDEQVKDFQAWRKKNYTNMVNVMNEIIERKVQFRILSLSPDISTDRLLALQSEIQGLQRELLEIKLSCRALIMTTFSDEQWDNFAFVVSENPKLASLFSQVDRVASEAGY